MALGCSCSIVLMAAFSMVSSTEIGAGADTFFLFSMALTIVSESESSTISEGETVIFLFLFLCIGRVCFFSISFSTFPSSSSSCDLDSREMNSSSDSLAVTESDEKTIAFFFLF
ncbi:hypothetical protein CsSME_00023856 [Camellia sinensis var. sinensis]